MYKYLYYSLALLFFISCGNLKKNLGNAPHSIGIINNVSHNTTSKNEAGEYEEKYDFENSEDEADEKKEDESTNNEDNLSLEGRDILFLGEGNFTFVKSFIKNHPELNGRIIATEIKIYAGLDSSTQERIKALRETNVKVILGFDATKIANNEELRNRKFTHIFFSHPYAGNPTNTRQLINDVFKNINAIQAIGDFFHLIRVNVKTNKSYNAGGKYRYVAAYGFHNLIKWVQDYDYAAGYEPINSKIQNYKAVKKIKFPREYEWEHTTTNNNHDRPKILDFLGSIEVVFEKIESDSDNEIDYESPSSIRSKSPSYDNYKFEDDENKEGDI